MRKFAAVLSFCLLTGAPAWADEAEPSFLATAAKPLRDRWQGCTAAAVKAHLDSKRPAESIADLALERCKAQEAALGRALKAQLGQTRADRIVTDLREFDRSVLIRIIEKLRGG